MNLLFLWSSPSFPAGSVPSPAVEPAAFRAWIETNREDSQLCQIGALLSGTPQETYFARLLTQDQHAWFVWAQADKAWLSRPVTGDGASWIGREGCAKEPSWENRDTPTLSLQDDGNGLLSTMEIGFHEGVPAVFAEGHSGRFGALSVDYLESTWNRSDEDPDGVLSRSAGPVFLAKAGRIYDGRALAWGLSPSTSDSSLKVEFRPLGEVLELHLWAVDDQDLRPPDGASIPVFLSSDHVQLFTGHTLPDQYGIARMRSGALDVRVLSSSRSSPPLPQVRWESDHFVVTVGRDDPIGSDGFYAWEAWISVLLADADTPCDGLESIMGLTAIQPDADAARPLGLVVWPRGGMDLPSPGESVPLIFGGRISLEP